MFEQMLKVRGQRKGFFAPLPQPKERADADAAESGSVGAFGGVQPPGEILFRPGRVEFGVAGLVVGFLENNDPLRTGPDERDVVFGGHRGDLHVDARDERGEGADAFIEVIDGDEFGVFPGD